MKDRAEYTWDDAKVHGRPEPTDRLGMIKRSAHALPVSREMLIDAGVLEPTPQELAERERAAAETRRLAAERAERRAAAKQQFDQLEDPLTRAILDLHAEDENGQCAGCDFDGYEAERPAWPCQTIDAVASHYGIDVHEIWL